MKTKSTFAAVYKGCAKQVTKPLWTNSFHARAWRVLGLGGLIALQAACASMSSLQTAETLEPGKSEQFINVGNYGDSQTIDGAKETKSLPFLEYSYRRGFAPDFDAGVKLTNFGAGTIDAKYRLLPGAAFNLAVGFGLGYTSYTESMTVGTDQNGDLVSIDAKHTDLDIMIPLYASYRFSDSFALYGSPRYILRHESVSGTNVSGSSNTSLVGGAAGVKIGNTWGTYLEVDYEKDTKSDFNIMQYNVALFWAH